MKSMTGYGKSNLQNANFAFDITVRAVNGRFLEVKIYSPKSLQYIENEIRQKVSDIINRGTIEISINKKNFSGEEEIHFNSQLAKKWLNGFNKVLKDLNMNPATDPQMLLSISDFVKFEEPKNISKNEKNTLIKLILNAVEKCDSVRIKEGLGLKKDIKKYLSLLKTDVQLISKNRDKNIKELNKKYEERLKKINSAIDVDEQRLFQEVVIQLDKIDISEEIQRLLAHLEAIDELTMQKGSIGKKLDFYAQELLREVNTIGSKSPSSDLTQIVVNAKSLIEKYREQVQNVE
jgi:uncharacterized protein (TIGR00255 family)